MNQGTIPVHVSNRANDDLQDECLLDTEEENCENQNMFIGYPRWSNHYNIQQEFDKLRFEYDDYGHALNEYLDDTLVYLLEREKRRSIRPDYLDVQPNFDIASRGIAINSLVLLSEKFFLHTEVLHMAVDYMDRFLSKRCFPRRDLALLTATCLFIALRQEEIYTVNFNDLIWPTIMSKKDFMDYEWFVLKELDFKLYVPNMYTFVSMFAIKLKLPPEVQHASYYIIELALLETSLLKYKPSLTAVAAIALAGHVLYSQLWTREYAKESGYTFEEFYEPYLVVCNLVIHSNFLVLTTSIRNKYWNVFQTFRRNIPTPLKYNTAINAEFGCTDYSYTVKDYTDDTCYLQLQEQQRRLMPDNVNFQTNMDFFTRALAVDHMAYLSEIFHFPSEVVHLAVDYMDRFLSDRYFLREDIAFLSITCLSIALRLRGFSVGAIHALLRLSKKSQKNIADFALFVLKALNFQLQMPTIYTFVSHFVEKWKLSSELECVSYYIAELTLLDISFLKYKPSVMAVASITLARFLLYSELWTEECVEKTGFCTEELCEPYVAISMLVDNVHRFTLKSIQRKYLHIFQNFYYNKL